jgi:biopolymer transport protein ExbD
MSRKPSQRSNIENNDPKELNLVPYLDIVTNIIMFMLITTTTLGAVGIINVAAPKYGGGAGSGGGPEKPPLNLSLAITDKGFYVVATGGVLPGIEKSPEGEKVTNRKPTIPKNTDPAACRAMKKNEEAPCYDYTTLTKKMQEIKKIFPDETKINLTADSDIPYFVLVNAMDATRENAFEQEEGKRKPLFYDVILAAGL